MDTFEEQVQHAARQFTYPPTPDIAGKIEAGARPPRLRRMPRIAYALALVAALIVAALAVPQVRAAVSAVIRLGAVIILDQPPAATPVLAELPDLPGRTTLADAREQLPFPLPLPGYPPDLGEPDAVFVHETLGKTATVVWQDEGLVLQLLAEGTIGFKVAPETVTEVMVGGTPGLWLTGEHILSLYDQQLVQQGGISRLIAGNVLIWQRQNVTYRIETQLPLEEALRIAASLSDS